MTDPVARLTEAFADRYGGPADIVTRAPGRVNLIGEHTDYNDGFVLPAAISASTWIAARRRSDHAVNIVALDMDDANDSFDLAAISRAGAPSWALYPRGMTLAMQQAGYALVGADIAITGTVPQGSGLSSSASLSVGFGLALATLAGLEDIGATTLAQLAQSAECDFVGTKCGIMDQLASARGQAGAALLIDCRSLDCVPVPIPAGTAIMIVQSGIVRGLVEGEYNLRRRQCEQAASSLDVAALRDGDLTMLADANSRMDGLSYQRARHVITENARTLAAADALGAGDLQTMGRLMAASHASMRDDFAITLPPIDQLVAILTAAIGDQGGARMTGGGFGGAVVALLPMASVAAVSEAVRRNYKTPAGTEPIIVIEQASDGASVTHRSQQSNG